MVASQLVTVVAARTALLRPPSEVAAGEAIELDGGGPRSSRNSIGVVPRGGGAGNCLAFAYGNPQHHVQLWAPQEAGDYDIVFVIGGELGEQVAARHPRRVR